MGNRPLNYYFVLLFLIVFGGLTKQSLAAGAKIKQISCPISSMSEVSYLGKKLSGGKPFRCIVPASGDMISDSDAITTCGTSNFINYYSSDYFVNGTNESSKGKSSTDGTSGSLYVCFNAGVRNPKKALCDQLASEVNKSANSKKVEWVEHGKFGHGYCSCDIDDRKPGANWQKCDGGAAPNIEVSDNKSKCEKLNGTWADSSCKCAEGSIAETVDVTKTVKCEAKPKSVADVAPAGVSKELENCLNEWKSEANSCKTKGQVASVSCDKENEDNEEVTKAKKEVDEAKRLAGVGGNLAAGYVNSRQGSGLVKECFNAGIIANAAKLPYSDLSEKCEQDRNSCGNLCSEDKMKTYEAKCKEQVGTRMEVFDPKDTHARAQNDIVAANQAYYDEKLKDIKELYENGHKLCGDSEQSSKMLNSALLGLASAIQAGQMCACQMVSTTANNCAPGSSVGAAVLDVCTMGSAAYNATACKCQFQPTAQGCSGFVQAATVSGFAGPDVKNGSTSSGGASVGTPPDVSAGGNGNFDLSGQKADDLAAPTKSNAAGPGFQSSSGGGGGGGGGGAPPASGGEENHAGNEGDGDQKTGLGGVFGQIKSTVGSLFGGGSNKNNTNSNGNGLRNSFNANKYRPNGLRGIASGSEFGTRNMDIWKMVNDRYTANDGTFKQEP